MRIIRGRGIVSPLVLILLLLCSSALGALVSYMWVMANYYNMQQGTTLLVLEKVDFSVANFTYFGLTVLNPSNSVSDANITAFRLSVEGKNETYDVTATEYPDHLPFLLGRGTRQEFKCLRNWGDLAGETVRIKPLAENTITANDTHQLPMVKLELTPYFDPSQTVENFTLILKNTSEGADLNVTEVKIFGETINATPALPFPLKVNETNTLVCNRPWDNLRGQQVTITVKTAQGFQATYVTDKLPGTVVSIDDIRFDYSDTSYLNLTISSLGETATSATLDSVNLTLTGQSPQILPAYYYFPNNTKVPVAMISLLNESRAVRCLWDWTANRNKIITIDVYTKQGFPVDSKTTKTPPEIIWNITDVRFDFDDMDHFLVSSLNTLCSLHEVNVTKIMVNNETARNFDPPVKLMPNGTEAQFNCAYDWRSLRGQIVNITMIAKDGTNVSRTIPIPLFELKFLGKPVLGEDKGPYVSITVSNSNNSLQNVTVAKITFWTNNTLYSIPGDMSSPRFEPDGYLLSIGENVTILCRAPGLFDHIEGRTRVTIYASDGTQLLADEWTPPF